MWLPFRLLFGQKAKTFLRFKEVAPSLSNQEIKEVYEQTLDVHFQRETDLNRQCIEKLLNEVKGTRVLDIACGRGFFSGLLAERGLETFGADIVISDSTRLRYPGVHFHVASLDRLPYEDNAFDTVICAHTLEHVRELQPAIAELRRVAAKRLLVVVPRQRNYRYTFDLHIHFFTYPHDLLRTMGSDAINQTCRDMGGDLLYMEDFLE